MVKASITLSTLSVRYFKGFRELEIAFDPTDTILKGANETGKTTLHDAWCWLLFSKDSHGNSDTKFGIKTKDRNNVVIPRVEHIVEGVLSIDGKDLTLKKVLKEKWVKTRGELEPTFQGNTTEYFWNDVPKSQREYIEKINEIVDEGVFKLLSDPLAFNSLHWEAQRNMLTTIAGEDSDADIAKGSKEFADLLDILSDKSLKEHMDELAFRKKKLKESMKDIPARIDEVSQGKPLEADYEALKSEKATIEKSLATVQAKIDDTDKANADINKEKTAIRDSIYDLEHLCRTLKGHVRTEIEESQVDPFKLQRELKEKLDNQQRLLNKHAQEKKDIEQEISAVKVNIESIGDNLTKLRSAFKAQNDRTLTFGEDFNCPSCKRPLEAEDIEKEKKDMLADFNEDKSKSLELINKQGLQLKENLWDKQSQLKVLEGQLQQVSGHIKDSEGILKQLNDKYEKEVRTPKESVADVDDLVKDRLDKDKMYQGYINEIAELTKKIDAFTPKEAKDHIEERDSINTRFEEIKETLREETKRAEADKRIAELEEQERKYAQQLADVEKQEYTAHEFTLSKARSLEDRVNKIFEGDISWKLFETQVNGAQVPTCICTYKGQDWIDVNTAGQAHVGTMIIAVLIKHYGISVPVWYDNAESVSVIPKIDAQQIMLYVDKSKKSITVG